MAALFTVDTEGKLLHGLLIGVGARQRVLDFVAGGNPVYVRVAPGEGGTAYGRSSPASVGHVEVALQ